MPEEGAGEKGDTLNLNDLLHYTKSKAEWHYAEGKRLKQQNTYRSITLAIVHTTKAEVYSEMGIKLLDAMYEGKKE